MSSEIPRSRKTSFARWFVMCARGLSAIQLPRDTMWQRTPEFASARAVVEPVGPAPIMSTSVSYAIAFAPRRFRIRAGWVGSMISVGLSGGHHRHAGDPAWNRFVELLLHSEVAARRERAEGGNPCQDFVGAATRRLTHLVGVERVGPPDLAAAQDLHEFLVPFRIERLAR